MEKLVRLDTQIVGFIYIQESVYRAIYTFENRISAKYSRSGRVKSIRRPPTAITDGIIKLIRPNRFVQTICRTDFIISAVHAQITVCRQ